VAAGKRAVNSYLCVPATNLKKIVRAVLRGEVRLEGGKMEAAMA